MSDFAMDHNPLQQLHSLAAMAGWVQPGPIFQFRDPLDYFPMNFLIELLDKSKHDAHSWWGIGRLFLCSPFLLLSFPSFLPLHCQSLYLQVSATLISTPAPTLFTLFGGAQLCAFSSVNSCADSGRMVDVHVHLVSSMPGFCLAYAGLVRAIPITISSCVHLPYCVWNFPWSYPPSLTILLLTHSSGVNPEALWARVWYVCITVGDFYTWVLDCPRMRDRITRRVKLDAQNSSMDGWLESRRTCRKYIQEGILHSLKYIW